jgi:hypothetical protein
MKLSFNKSTKHLILSLYDYESNDITKEYGFRKISGNVFSRKFSKKVVKDIIYKYPKIEVDDNVCH